MSSNKMLATTLAVKAKLRTAMPLGLLCFDNTLSENQHKHLSCNHHPEFYVQNPKSTVLVVFGPNQSYYLS